MTLTSFWLFFTSILVLANYGKGDGDCGDVGKTDTLQMTVVLFRHGDRAPGGTYPTDPHQEDAWKKYGGFGKLTQVGMQQHYNFGKWWRKCYGAFLTDLYNPSEIYVRSTAVDRTIMSAQSHVAGLFGPKDYQVWSSSDEIGKYWQPVPIFTMGRDSVEEYMVEEMLLPPDGYCPKYDNMIQNAWASDSVLKKLQNENQKILDYIGQNTGLSVPGSLFEVAFLVADTIYIEKLKQLQLPSWINSTVEKTLVDWKDLWLYSHTTNDDTVRLGVGTLCTNLLQLLQKKVDKKSAYKHVIYSSHDMTVASMLRIFDQKAEIVVPYAAGLITELHLDKTKNRYFVKVFYRPDPAAAPTPIKIRNCGQPCWFDDFARAMRIFSLSARKPLC